MTTLRVALAAVAALPLASCGFGTAGIVAGSSNDSSSNSTPSLSLDVQGFTIELPKEPPAKIKLTLFDPESDPAKVELFYVVPSAPTTVVPMSSVGPNPVTLATSPDGIEHSLTWDYPNESRLPDDGSYVEGVKVIARVDDGASRELVFGLGNDAPVVDDIIEPLVEVSGVVPIGFRVRDSSADLVDVRAEFLVSSRPDLGWRTARPAGPGSSTTPDFAFRGVEGARGGTDFIFFWDTDFDLGTTDEDVRVRFSARDDVVLGAATESNEFRVDNNEEPVVQIGDSFNVGPDRRRGIPIPYRVFDDEGDPVRVLFQWRREGDLAFPDLGTEDPDEIATLLTDPVWALEKQICTQFPTYAHGHVVVVDETHVRVPELAGHESWIVADGGAGLELQLLRPRGFRRVGSDWPHSLLQRPVATLPLDDGERALVLDGGPSGWRLEEIELSTGASRTVAARSGAAPRAIARRARTELILSEAAGIWRLDEVDRRTGTVVQRFDAASSTDAPMGSARGLAWIDDATAVVTIGDAAWKVVWVNTNDPTASLLSANLQDPRGLAPDPHRPRTVWVAEHAADRVARIDVDTRTVFVGPALPSPDSLVFDRNRMLAVCGPDAMEIRRVTIGSTEPSIVLATLEGSATSIALGKEGTVWVTHADLADISVNGGVEQTRRVVSFDPTTATVELDAPLAPSVRHSQACRIRARHSFENPVAGSTSGRAARFVWDSSDVGDANDVLLRAHCFDSEAGLGQETTGGAALQHGLDVPAEGFPLAAVPNEPGRFQTADIDADGDLDLLVTGGLGGSTTIHYQDASRSFASPPLELPGAISPSDAVAVDLDGDGDLDVVVADSDSNGRLHMFVQGPTGTFSHVPVVDSGPTSSLLATDLDGDGDADLVSPAVDGGVEIYTVTAPATLARSHVQLDGGTFFTLAVGDMDGDGRSDVVCAHVTGVAILYQSADGAFGADVQWLRATQPGSRWIVRSAVPTDVDADGDLDIVFAQDFGPNSTARIVVLRQDAPRQFSDEEIERFPMGAFPWGLDASDIDGDGDTDLLLGTRSPGVGPRVYVQSTPGRFHRANWSNSSAGSSRYVRATDMDGDGAVDLVSTDGPSISIWYQATRGVSHHELVHPAAKASERAADASMVDVDGDGDLDLVSAFLRDGIRIDDQTTPGSFESPTTVLEAAPFRAYSADLDGDGRQDVLTFEGPGVVVRYRTDLGDFDAPVTLPSSGATQPADIVVVDLDGDGDLDVVAAHQLFVDADGAIGAWVQFNPREFEHVTLFTEPAIGFDDAASSDLDRDGDLDIVAVQRTLVKSGPAEHDLLVLWRLDDGTLEAEHLPWAGQEEFVRVEDLDEDGTPELVVFATLGSEEGVAVFSRSADGSFDTLPLFLTANSWRTPFAIADVDGDGDRDLTDGTNAFLQTADGSFEFGPLLEDLGGTVLWAGDADGDGELDFVVSASPGLEIVWGGR